MTSRAGNALRGRVRRTAPAIALAAIVAIVAACGGPVLANPPAQRPIAVPSRAATPAARHDPVAVVLPADDAPHDRLTEWWYYTGHLRDASGGRWGFEFVVFRAERGNLPVSWASHVALTDETGRTFRYAQRSEIGPQVSRPRANRFDLAVSGADPTRGAAAATSPWTMTGGDGADRLSVAVAPGETSAGGAFGLDLDLHASKPPALHDRDGWIDFGVAGGSYYYSRTAEATTGTLVVDGRTLHVDGTAWFDHQWGDFIAVGGGGWDWFAINLDDGTDVTLSLVRDRTGGYPLVYGTVVDRSGATRHLNSDAFTVRATGRWQSPVTGTNYPAAWHISVPGEALEVDLVPTVAGQELDTRRTTGVVYWEGSQRVTASHHGRAVNGQAYVELTGYGAAPGGG